jgi:hypothetical protein
VNPSLGDIHSVCGLVVDRGRNLAAKHAWGHIGDTRSSEHVKELSTHVRSGRMVSGLEKQRMKVEAVST